MIGRLRRMFAQPGFAGLGVALGLTAMSWPFLDLARESGIPALFSYLFGVWGGLVLLAFLVARSVADGEPGGDEDA